MQRVRNANKRRTILIFVAAHDHAHARKISASDKISNLVFLEGDTSRLTINNRRI